MKKLISLALVLVMLFAVAAVAASAAEDFSSPVKEYFVVVDSEGNGSAKTSSDKYIVSEDSENITLTATSNGGYFTKWLITGNYEIVSGDIYSETLVIKPLGNIKAIASYRLEEDRFCIIIGESVGDGTVTASPEKVEVGSGDTCKITATDGKDKFVRWIIDCEYDLVSGSLTDREIVIRPYTDVHVTGVFTGNGSEPTETKTDDGSKITPSAPKTTSDTSPKTGDPTFAIVAIVLMASFAGAFAVKKIKE